MNKKMVRNCMIVALLGLVSSIPATSAYGQFPDNWIKDPSNPISTEFAGSTVLFHDGIYKSWGLGGPRGIQYATSLDGRSWMVDPNPVLVPGPGDYDAFATDNASVVIVDGTYHLFYSGVDASDDSRIAHATSQDGIIWVKDPENPVMDLGRPGDIDSNELIHPKVIYEEPVFRMWYNAVGSLPQLIAYAVSLDGTLWARDPDPALTIGPIGEWDDYQLYMMDVVLHDGTYYMFYTGSMVGGDFGIGYATSPDGQAWTKRSPSAPVLGPGGSGTWDEGAVVAPVVIPSGNSFTLYYAATDDFSTVSWGMAIAGPPTAAPSMTRGRLEQNSPNPFNPRTVIHYELAKAGRVDLDIYDASGRLVRSLIRGVVQNGGSHEAPWDGRNDEGESVVSGVYYYRLESEDYLESKKMVLVR